MADQKNETLKNDVSFLSRGLSPPHARSTPSPWSAPTPTSRRCRCVGCEGVRGDADGANSHLANVLAAVDNAGADRPPRLTLPFPLPLPPPQSNCKRDPEGYVDEFETQVRGRERENVVCFFRPRL